MLKCWVDAREGLDGLTYCSQFCDIADRIWKLPRSFDQADLVLADVLEDNVSCK